MPTLRFPTAEIARHLRDIRHSVTSSLPVPVRLTLYPNGEYSITFGPDIPTEYHSHTTIPLKGKFDSLSTARTLINQAADTVAYEPEWTDIKVHYALTRKQRDVRRAQDELCARESARLSPFYPFGR